jgi:hypothetical protein
MAKVEVGQIWQYRNCTGGGGSTWRVTRVESGTVAMCECIQSDDGLNLGVSLWTLEYPGWTLVSESEGRVETDDELRERLLAYGGWDVDGVPAIMRADSERLDVIAESIGIHRREAKVPTACVTPGVEYKRFTINGAATTPANVKVACADFVQQHRIELPGGDIADVKVYAVPREAPRPVPPEFRAEVWTGGRLYLKHCNADAHPDDVVLMERTGAKSWRAHTMECGTRRLRDASRGYADAIARWRAGSGQ